jgi:outer membrane protein TolC
VRRLAPMLALALVLTGPTASADEAAPAQNAVKVWTRDDAPALSFEQAITMGRKNNRTIRADRAKLAEAETSVEQAWGALLPTIAGEAKYTRNYKQVSLGFPGSAPLLLQPSNQLDLVISATTPLIAPAAYPALESVKASAKAAEADFSEHEAALLVDVARAFLAAAGNDELVTTRRSQIEVAQATLRDAQIRLAAGSVTKVDVDRAELAYVRAVQAERETVAARNTTYRALATLIQAEHPFKVSAQFPTAPMPDPNDLDMALRLRPQFQALQLAVNAADAEGRAQAWRWAPTLSAFGNARKFNYDNFVRDRHSWAVGGQLDWVLFDGGGRDADRHRATARAAEAQAQAEVLRDKVRDDLANETDTLMVKRLGVEAAEHSVTLAQESLELIRTQYAAGTGTQLDLLQAQDAIVAAHLSLVQARFDVAAADLALRYAAGTFPPK